MADELEFEGVGTTFQSAQFCVRDGTFKGGKLYGINVRNILVNYQVRGNGTVRWRRWRRMSLAAA